MGNQVTIGILTDRWDEIKKNPKMLIDCIQDGMLSHGDNTINIDNRTSYYHGNGIAVRQYHHADCPEIVLSHHNSLIGLDPDAEMEYLIKAKKIIDDYIQMKKDRQTNGM